MKLLVIRFSSFGDIVQAMGVVDSLAKKGVEVHWATRQEFVPLVSLNGNVARVWGLERSEGLRGLFRLGWMLRKQRYDIVYDAHSSLRSCLLRCLLAFSGGRIVRRSKQRIRRMLLFNFGINTFPRPYRGMLSYRKPLEKIFSMEERVSPQQWHFSEVSSLSIEPESIVLCPGAAWKMKRWPLSHWIELVKLMRDFRFVVLGGKGESFCEDLAAVDPSRIVNIAGKSDLIQSCRLVSRAPLVIAADTGLIHVADILGIPGISLMGPTAFGFPSGESVVVLEKDLACRPCSKDGRGGCSREVWQQCMVDISPGEVASKAKEIILQSGL